MIYILPTKKFCYCLKTKTKSDIVIFFLSYTFFPKEEIPSFYLAEKPGTFENNNSI